MKSFFSRFIYLGYYLKQLDWSLYRKFLSYAAAQTGKSKISLVLDSIYSVFRYNISLLEYFQFRFYEKNSEERGKWAGMGFMYESIRILNPPSNRVILNDKREFFNHYNNFVGRKHILVSDLSKAIERPPEWLKNGNRKLVLKNSFGQCGNGIEILQLNDVSLGEIVSRAQKGKNDIIEEFVSQHHDLNTLSPSGLNTLRIITQINRSGGVDILGVRLRISVNSIVDNMAAGNMAAEVDQESGIVIGPGVFSDITKKDCYRHPRTGQEIIGFKVPFFKESIKLAREAALYDTSNTSIGWDIGITEHGPVLIEGNHDWCKLLWQLPVKRGLKKVLETYVQDYI